MLHTFIPLFVCTLHIPTIQCELERSKLNSRAVYMDRHTMKTDVCLLMSTIAWTMQIIVQSKRTNNVADPVQWAQWSPHTDTHTHTSIERENRNKQIDHHLLFWRAPFPQTRNEREKNAMEKKVPFERPNGKFRKSTILLSNGVWKMWFFFWKIAIVNRSTIRLTKPLEIERNTNGRKIYWKWKSYFSSKDVRILDGLLRRYFRRKWPLKRLNIVWLFGIRNVSRWNG